MGGTGLENGSRPAVGVMTAVQPILASVGVILVGSAGSVFMLKCMARMESKEAKEMQCSRERGADGVINNEDNTDEEIEEFNIRIEANTRTTRTRAMLPYGTFGPTIKLAVMIIVSLGYSILAEYVGSSRLLGAFVAGVFFSHSAPMRMLYEEQIAHKIQPVMSAIFFATIGFAIPLTKILDPVLFGWGAVYAVIATLSKLATVVVSPTSTSEEYIDRQKARWLVSTAMVARGELGLLMIQQALLQGLIGQAVMVVTTWSIVLCTLVGIGSLSFAMKAVVARGAF
ncbi:Hsp70 ATPase ssc1 [Mortierella polycephala]|uniref:Hsp70 ATPase ssc1 n=1 Tax=Mortierella polycephala TaxID=41804 RepID=A0A9P6PI93_9FUNG|nr:Hsp70 ATPase ssc1 [Mortierella polycephala]